MSALIELSQKNDSGALSIQLIDLLRLIPEEDQKLVWAILDLEAIGDISEVWQAGILDLESQIQQSPMILNWQDLVKLANSFEDVINLTLVACLSSKLPAVNFKINDPHSCVFVFELIDSTVWKIYAAHQEKLDRFLNAQLKSAA
ncbi:hypothetical protein ACQ4M3_30250 [Leptolyngbya sp. AN03gr2]|uniref:hypothetical protein n=1 Tax=unclassified Leptolyngbya TaxID=2650499 RepID=UPI003D32128E